MLCLTQRFGFYCVALLHYANGDIDVEESPVSFADLRRCTTVPNGFYSDGFSINTMSINLDINNGMASPCN
jgi:hypothetical protein